MATRRSTHARGNRSTAWDYFEESGRLADNPNTKLAKCKLCKASAAPIRLSLQSTSSMWNHLKRWHKATWSAAKAADQAKSHAISEDEDEDDPRARDDGVAGDIASNLEVEVTTGDEEADDGAVAGTSQAHGQEGSEGVSQSLITKFVRRDGKTTSKRAPEPEKSKPPPKKAKSDLVGQPSIKSSLSRMVPYPNTAPKQARFDKAVTYWLAVDNHSFRSVEGAGFEKLVHTLDPRVTIKTRTTYSRDKLESLYDEVKGLVDAELNKSVKELFGIAFTTDMWTSRNNDAYLSLTAHFITLDFHMKSFLVGMKPFEGAHTGVRIAAEMDSTIDTLQLNDKALTHRWCVNDRGANVVLAVKKSIELDTELFCIDHTLHLIVTKAVKDVALVTDAMDQCRKVAAHFHRSTKHSELLRKKCTELDIPYKKVVLPCPTRWNSQFQSIKSILDLKVALVALAADVDLDNLLPSSAEYEVLVQASPILEKFEEASVLFSAQKVPTLHRVIPALVRIDAALEKLIKANTGVKDFALALKARLEHYFPQHGIEKEEYCYAHFLDPTMKGVVLRDAEDDSEGALKGVIDGLIASSNAIDDFLNPPQESQPVVAAQVSSSESDDDDPIQQRLRRLTRRHPGLQPSVAEGQGSNEIRAELDRYLQSPVAIKGTDVLAWWRGMAAESYPKLGRLAKRYLCIPASSSASERIFSDAGNVVTASRNNLKVNNVEKLVYIKENSKFVNINWKV